MRTHVTGHHIAVAVGFEPTVGCPTQHFECCTFGRSDTLPGTVFSCWCGYPRPKAPKVPEAKSEETPPIHWLRDLAKREEPLPASELTDLQKFSGFVRQN